MKFRKKPVVVEATQWFKDGDHPSVLMCWFDGMGKVRWAPGDVDSINVYGCIRKPAIATLEGWHVVTPGDWIITGVKGEHYPCKPDIFEMTYEVVVAVPGAIDIDDLVAELETQSPENAKALACGRKWVAENFYADRRGREDCGEELERFAAAIRARGTNE